MEFLGINLAMGIGKLPSYDDYWGSGITRMLWFSSIMTRDRFRELSKYFHLVDNRATLDKNDPNFSKLFKLGGLDEKLMQSFSDSITLDVILILTSNTMK